MRTLTRFAAAAVLVAGTSGTAMAQSMSSGAWFKAPVFLAQPGVVTINAIGDEPDAESQSFFNIRFATVVPTASPWFSLVFGTQWLPNGPEIDGLGVKNNSPSFFYGAIIPVALVGDMSQGWLSMSIDPLGVFAGGLGGTDRYIYGHDFFLEAAFVLNVGSKMMETMGPWSGLGVYFLVDQRLTHNKFIDDSGEEKNDYWNPTLLFGASLPIAPWGR